MTKIQIIILVVLVPIVFFTSSCVFAEISVESTVNKSEITVGDEINYSVKVVHDPNTKVILPPLGVNLGNFEIKDYETYKARKNSEGNIEEKVSYIISNYETGEHIIPPVRVGYTLLNGTTGELFSAEIKIKVKSVLPSEAKDIRDIKKPLSIPVSYRWLYWTMVLVVIAGIVIYFVIRAIRARRQRKEMEPPPPAHVIAYHELRELTSKDYPGKNMIKQYYIEISDIIRKYLQLRFSVFARERYTGELMEEFRERKIAGEEVTALLQNFLEFSDLIKFAKYPAAPEDNERVMKQAYEFVDRTKIEPPVVNLEEGTGSPRHKGTETSDNEAEPVAEEKQ